MFAHQTFDESAYQKEVRCVREPVPQERLQLKSHRPLKFLYPCTRVVQLLRCKESNNFDRNLRLVGEPDIHLLTEHLVVFPSLRFTQNQAELVSVLSDLLVLTTEVLKALPILAILLEIARPMTIAELPLKAGRGPQFKAYICSYDTKSEITYI